MSDFSGKTLSLRDKCGDVVDVEVFVAVLPYSNLIYAESVLDQKINNRAMVVAHRRALECFKGVPKCLIIDNLKFISGQGERINAQTTLQMLKKIEKAYPLACLIHVILDNARYHHAKMIQPWLNRPGCRIKLHFLPPYAPHLNSIERLWGLMHVCVTHNQHYDTYADFTEAISGFFEKTLPENWEQFRDTVTDNLRVISPKQYKII